MFLSVLSDLNKICFLKHIKHVETNKLVRYTVLGLLMQLRACRCGFSTTKLGPFLWPRTALNYLSRSVSAFFESSQLLSVDSADESKRQQMQVD